jgi:hypothetical protein
VPDIGRTTLETVENLSPIENTPGNSRENTSVTTASDGEEVGALGHLVPLMVGPARARDATVLLLIVRLRIASIQQLANAAFPNVSVVVARRRLRALHDQGWIRVWDRPVASGGAPRYVYPTAKALRWAYPRLLELARGTPSEQIVRLMIPDSTKRLVQLEAGSEPQWFAHQDEINRLLLARSAAAGEDLLWASSWDCPFPDRLNGLKAPQPDYVLITIHGSKALLTFGEHDRATAAIPAAGPQCGRVQAPRTARPPRRAHPALRLERARVWSLRPVACNSSAGTATWPATHTDIAFDDSTWGTSSAQIVFEGDVLLGDKNRLCTYAAIDERGSATCCDANEVQANAVPSFDRDVAR